MESLKYEIEKLKCDCGGTKFQVVARSIVEDVAIPKGARAWVNSEEWTTLEEEYLEVVCLKCGKILVESFHEKPISKRGWDEFWNSHMVYFIMGFEHYVVDQELEDEDVDEKFLKGIGKGMWSLYRFIEAEMVREKTVKR